jgi:hypothetical protein
MTNMYENLGPDDLPTAPYSATRSGGGAPGGRRRRWTAVLAVTAVVVGGGSFAVAEAATGSPAATTQASGATQASTTTQAAAVLNNATQAAVLNNVLRGHAGIARLRRLGGMYGQFTFDTKKGARTVAFERGTVTSVSGGDVVVRARNGTSWSWTLTGTSVVREDGKPAKTSALAPGQLVFTGGPLSGSTRDVRLIVIRKAAATGTA